MVPEFKLNTFCKLKYILENHTLTAKTLAGLEPILAKEIEKIGGKNIHEGRRAVTFTGTLKHIYRANYYLRTAIRILKEVDTFTFKSIDDFYGKCRRIKWQNYMDENLSFAVFSTVANSREFNNSMFASLKVKDAIVDSFRALNGSRPVVDANNPEISINVRVSQHRCTISIDSSGESLHKRGYRAAQGDAPLSEVLAAGMILMTGWNGETDFIDPMCGSGTLPIEAAMIATNTPPGKFRKEFAFEKWEDFDLDLFNEVTQECELKSFNKTIYASDISERNIGIAKSNARNAKVYNQIQFEATDIKDINIKANGATIIINPPYGERIWQKNLESLYTTIGERLKHKFPGNEAWILSSSRELLKFIGLKPARKSELFNGALLCSYRKYELFQGKRVS